MVGHDALKKEYLNLADKRELAQGYIFFGPAGVGKRTFAASLANYLETGAFEETSIRPLGDYKVISPGEERSLGIDAIREAKSFLQRRPEASPYRVLVIDQAEVLTVEAENALLKITEEPTSSAIIILVATAPEELLPTLQSRMRPIYFAPLPDDAVQTWLMERGIKQKEAAELAKRSFGRPGLALRMHSDESYQQLLETAKDFLKGSPASRKSIIKSLTDEETFSLDAFLEALMIVGYPEYVTKTPFWHAVLALRGEARKFGLNAKLQLTALQKALEF